MATLIKIGNSKGLRLPKAIIEQAQLERKELKIKIVKEGLLIQPVQKPRQGWEDQFKKNSSFVQGNSEEKEWLEASFTDEKDWEW